MSNLPLIDNNNNELTTIYHRNKKNIRIECSISDHTESKAEIKLKIVEYSCVHRQNMPIIVSIEIIHLSKYQNQSYLIIQTIFYIGNISQTNESIISFLFHLNLCSKIYFIIIQNKIQMLLLLLFSLISALRKLPYPWVSSITLMIVLFLLFLL